MSWRPALARPHRNAPHRVSQGIAESSGPAEPWGTRCRPGDEGPPNANDAPSDPDGWCWVGVHGGAGVTTLARAAGCGSDVSTMPPNFLRTATVPVVNVARTSAYGLERAQQVARLSERNVTVFGEPATLLGLVLVADAPGRLPKPLAELRHLVSGAFPRVWDVPWVEAWRLGDPPSELNTPKEVRRLVKDLRSVPLRSVDLRLRLHPDGGHNKKEDEP